MNIQRSTEDHHHHSFGPRLVAVLCALLVPAVSWATDVTIGNTTCATQHVFEAKLGKRTVISTAGDTPCPRHGGCDDPAVRNGYLSDGRITILRLYFQVVCMDDGSNPAATALHVAAQVDSLNSDFAPYGFRFDYDLRFINSTRYRFLMSFDDAEQMKSDYAVDPDRQLNIYVTTNAFCLCSYATYPWDPDALTSQGGIVMTRERFYPQSHSGSFLTHEVGHCLGLWHTQRGVNEVAPCSDCYESVGATNRDVSGDFCEDTEPTPSNFTCLAPGGIDQCSGRPWGSANPQNHMGYGLDGCLSEFTPQQAARMHCWTDSRLGSMTDAVPPGDTLFGAAPFTISLNGRAERSVTRWHWDFGDGETSAAQNPTHTYHVAGVFNIRGAVVTDSGTYRVDGLPQVYVTGDTLVISSGTAETNMSARVDISINNRVPLSHAVIPLSWDGPFGLTFDSISTVGLRTSHLTAGNGGIAIVDLQPSNRRITIAMNTDPADLIYQGSGKILSLYFHTPSTMFSGENPIQIIGYDANRPTLRTIPGEYSPSSVSGSLKLGCCVGLAGNIDGDAQDIVDLDDLSMLIMNLFIDSRLLPCPREANVDGSSDGSIDISDLTALIDYLYVTFTPPTECQ